MVKKKASSQRNVVNVVDNPCEKSFELKCLDASGDEFFIR